MANIEQTFQNNHQTGDGPFTRKCMEFFKAKYNMPRTLFTPSGTASLEMMAMILDLQPGDEVIMPAYTFVSSANAFAKFNCKPVFVDSLPDNPNMDADLIEAKITGRTRAILMVHYGGWVSDMAKCQALCEKYNLVLLEDAAQSVHHFYKGQPLGTFGDISAVSFHGTKIVGCGEGGMLIVNNEKYHARAEIIREKGTNLMDYYKGLTTYYEWMDKGSSYLLSDINAAYLLPQLEEIDQLAAQRKKLWRMYFEGLVSNENFIKCPQQDEGSNFYIFYIRFKTAAMMNHYRAELKAKGISSCPHFKPLHTSPYYVENYPDMRAAYPNAESFELILRIPLFNALEPEKVTYIVETINAIEALEK